METKRISLWSGPRNVSTALMYSFAQRADTEAYDEPLYAHYLTHETDRPSHPGESEIIGAQENDGRKVIEELFLAPSKSPVRFFKNMAHHLVGLEWDFLGPLSNVLLTRHPKEMLMSYKNTIPEFKISDTGYPKLKRLCDTIVEMGQEPIVIDSRILLQSPKRTLEKLCHKLGIPFYESMLSWPKGPKKEDGVWGPHWYHNVHLSAGFAPYRPKTERFPNELQKLLETCLPLYEALSPWVLK